MPDDLDPERRHRCSCGAWHSGWHRDPDHPERWWPSAHCLDCSLPLWRQRWPTLGTPTPGEQQRLDQRQQQLVQAGLLTRRPSRDPRRAVA